MLPAQILSKMVELVVGDAVKDFLSRRRDRRRKFAETLLFYYLSLKEYGSLCKEMISILERNGKSLDGRRLWPSDARRLQEISDGMSKLVVKFYAAFEPEWEDGGYLVSSSDPEARNRHTAVRIYDEGLAGLISSLQRGDDTVAGILYRLSKQEVSFDKQEFRLVEPTEMISAEPLLELSEYRRHKEGIEGMEGCYVRVLDLKDQDDYQRLVGLLRDYSTLIDELVAKVADFIKQNFKIDEIL